MFIHPDSDTMKYWDGLTFVALIYTALVVPPEVAFIDDEADNSMGALFWMDRLVDIIFFADMALNFFLAYVDVTDSGHQLVTDLKKIRHRYFYTWFGVDVVSIIPFDLFGSALENGALAQLRVLRLIRLLRLLKLLRVLRASRIISRWQAYFGFSFKTMALITFSITVVTFAHWMACLWALVGWQNQGFNWIRGVEAYAGKHVDYESKLDVYALALYWSIYTLTSIGYGDVTAQTPTELWVCALCMLASGVVWASLIGNACSLMGVDAHTGEVRTGLCITREAAAAPE